MIFLNIVKIIKCESLIHEVKFINWKLVDFLHAVQIFINGCSQSCIIGEEAHEFKELHLVARASCGFAPAFTKLNIFAKQFYGNFFNYLELLVEFVEKLWFDLVFSAHIYFY